MNASREYIELYLSHGLTPIPLRRNSKAPKVEKWPSLPRDFLIEGFEDGDNVGIRIERPLFIVDVDDRRLAPLILDEFNSRTWIVETRRGVHFYFAAPKGHYPETNKRGRLIQLLAEGCQVVAPPSRVDGHEYRFLCDPEEAAIAEVGEDKLMLLEAIVEAVARHEQLILRFAEAWDEGHRHNISLWLNGYLRKSRVPRLEAAVVVKSICLLANDSELKDRLRALDDTYRKPLDQVKGISGLIEELASIVGRDRLREFLEVLPKPTVEHFEVWPLLEGQAADRRRVGYVVGGEVLDDGRLIEVVLGDEGRPRLLVFAPSTGSFEVCERLVSGDAEMRPYPDLPYLEYLPGVPEAISEDHGLWRETLEFIKEYYDNPRSDDAYHVMTACIGWSYFCDSVRVSTPYLCFLGPFRSGKTRALEVMAS
ncbi:MAG: bifunctional DNA primase/polymerase, partial [Aigarchaeota archaeon]|nr:bifunctional DNA primase/polymerase [Candidatus Calditenuaceae archaeon]